MPATHPDPPRPPIGRDRELAEIVAACRPGAPTGSLILIRGPAGVGKTTLAVAAARAITGGSPLVARGHRGARRVPFGMVRALLGDAAPRAGGAPSETEAALAALVGRSAGGTLVVDDAPSADPQSLAAFMTLTVTRCIHLIVTARSGEPVPAPIADLTDAGAVVRIELQPLTGPDIRLLVERELGDAVDPASVRTVHEKSGGNALTALQLIADADWRRTAVGWTLERIQARPAITELLGARLSRLSARETAAVEVVALAEPVMIDAPEPLERALKLGIVAVDRRPEGFEARLGHPLYLDVLRNTTPPDRWVRASGLAADLLLARARDGRPDGEVVDAAAFFRGVMLRLDAGGMAPTDDVVRAAGDAVTAMDFPLALRITEAGLTHDPDHPELLEVRAAALAGVLAPAAEDAFAHAAASARDDDATVRIAIRYARFVASTQGDPERATRILGDAAAALSPGDGRDLLRFEQMRWRLRFEPPDPATADPSSAPAVDAVATLFGAHLALVQGHFDRIEALSDHGLAIAATTDVPVALYSETLSALRVFAWFFRGDLARARDGARTALSDPAPMPVDAVTTWSHLLALIELYAGRHATAVRYAQEAVHGTGWVDALALSGATRAVLAVALARSGRIAEAARTLRPVDPASIGDPGVHLSLLEARVLIALARGGSPAQAANDCVTTARFGLERGAVTMTCMAAHISVRLGVTEPRALEILATHAPGCDGWYVPLLAHHARALADGDRAALVTCAERFEAGGFMPNAGEAFVQAMALGDSGAGAVTARRGALRTGAIELSTREREVADMACAGITSREIGDRLGLSRRTVENHLARIYRRVGVAGRRELAEIIVATEVARTV